MRLATIRTATGTTAARVTEDGTGLVWLDAPDVGTLLRRPDWRSHALSAGAGVPADAPDFAPLVPRPGKILCVGLNYRKHIAEMGRELPEYPTVFGKFAPALIGAHDPIVLPASSAAMDWEAELAVIIGAPVRHANLGEATAAIAGYTVLNDVTARDWQYRTTQWLQGKTFEATTPIGPYLVTVDPDVAASGFELRCTVDGVLTQRANTADLVFGPAELVSYLSTVLTLEPGDVIATGTPGGVGHARDPRWYLAPGSRLVTTIDGIGECGNICRAEWAPR